MTEYHSEIIRTLQVKARDLGLQVPSPAFIESGATIVDYVSMRGLLCEFPIPATASSVDGTVPFGFIAHVVDQVSEVLAFLVSGLPCTAVSLNVNCIRPMSALHGPITVDARLRNRSRSLVFVEAKVSGGEGRTVATAALTLTVGSSKRDD